MPSTETVILRPDSDMTQTERWNSAKKRRPPPLSFLKHVPPVVTFTPTESVDDGVPEIRASSRGLSWRPLRFGYKHIPLFFLVK
jgi:hypothetical protein